MLAWHAHPDVWLLFTGLTAAYFVALRRLGPIHAPIAAPPATARQKTCFLLGIAALWAGADWPMHELSEDFLFSVHMVQHTLFSLVGPPLLLLGLPAWLVRIPLADPRVTAVAKALTRPLVALIVFNVVIVTTHWPVIVDASLRSEPLHFVVHAVLFGSAILMWWPVVDPVPELARLTPQSKMLYLFLQSVVPTVPASFLTFAQAPIYEFYTTVPRIIDLSVVDDQRIAGLIMKLGGGLLLWGVIATLFFRWNAREERQEAAGDVTTEFTDELTWEDFEHDLRAWNLRR